MPKRFAQIENGLVVNVVVCDSQEWLETNLGGTWVETQKYDDVQNYAGKGHGYYTDSEVKFAPQWRQPSGAEEAYPAGFHVFHNDMIWQSNVPNNVWEPGVFGWFDALSEVPKWIQPLGAGSEYAMDAEVMHKGRHWKSIVPANVWEPGVYGWEDITAPNPIEQSASVEESVSVSVSVGGGGPAPPPDWVQPTGAHDAYNTGDRVTYNGQIWVSTVDANVWAPGVFGWELE